MTDKRTLETQLEDLAASYFKPDEPGASIIVIRDGQPLLRTGYGLANIELGVRIQPEMVFRLGSITKQFTAVAILMLEERGQLSLQDPIERFIADYPTHGHTITIEHLLTHTAGIKSYTAMPEFWSEAKEDKSVLDHIGIFKDQPLAFAPGQRFVQFAEGEPTQALSALSPTEFCLKDSLTRLRFVMDDTSNQGQAVQVWDRGTLADEGPRTK